MKKHRAKYPTFVVCTDNSEYPVALELHKLYRVLPDEEAAADGDVRVIDESGEDYLYPSEYFLPVQLAPETEETLENSFTRHLARTA